MAEIQTDKRRLRIKNPVEKFRALWIIYDSFVNDLAPSCYCTAIADDIAFAHMKYEIPARRAAFS